MDNLTRQIEILVNMDALSRAQRMLAFSPASSLPPPQIVFLEHYTIDVVNNSIHLILSFPSVASFNFENIKEVVDKFLQTRKVSVDHIIESFRERLRTLLNVQNKRTSLIRSLFPPLKFIPQSLHPVRHL
jgi:hypothetical protein